MNDQELEQELRAGLSRHADEVVVTSAVLGRVRATTARRRRTRVIGSVAAAAAVVGVVGGTALLAGGDDGRDRHVPTASDPTTSAAPDGSAWRMEAYGALRVDVPSDWGYGGAPYPTAGGGKQACNTAAVVGPDGRTGPDDPTLGYVGRPIELPDGCADYPLADDPTQPYAWLGGDVAPGTVNYDNGFVQETVEVGGVTLTVGSDDADLRRQVLASARASAQIGANAPCHASFGTTVPSGDAGVTAEGRGAIQEADVCAYRMVDGAFLLVYAASLDEDLAAEALAAQEQAPQVNPGDACRADLSEFVVLQARYDDDFGGEPLERRAVYEMGCGGEVDLGFGDPGAPSRTHMVPAGVTPWASGGIPAIVYGPTDPVENFGASFIFRY